MKSWGDGTTYYEDWQAMTPDDFRKDFLYGITLCCSLGGEGLDVAVSVAEKAFAEARSDALEGAARIADEYAREHEYDSEIEEDADYKKRFLVYAKHVRRVAAAIRALKDDPVNVSIGSMTLNPDGTDK